MKLKAPIIIVGFSVLIGICAAYISFLPKIVVIKAEEEIKVDKEDLVTFFSQTESWKSCFFELPDSSIRYLQIKNKSGVGSGFKWFSDVVGDGAFHLKLISPDSVFYEMITDDNRFREKGKFYFSQKDSLTTIAWVDSLDISTSLFSRFAARDSAFTKRMEVQNTTLLKNIEKHVLNAKNRRTN